MARPQPHHALPPTLLDSPEWWEACRHRDFARIFRLVKLKAGIYPSRIAALCGMTPSRVGEIMAGRRSLAHIDVIERVADGLRIPGAMLGLAHRPWEIPSPARTQERQPEPVTAVPSEPELPPDESGGLDDLLALADGQVTRSTLTALRSSVEDYWRRDDEHGGAALRPAVVGHLRYVSQLFEGAGGGLRQDLQSLAAELARLAGWAYFDACQYSTARTYFAQALKLSHSQGDRLFMANILSCMSLQATYDGHPNDAVALACKAQDAARAAAGGHPLVMSMLHMREAFAHATLRDSRACHEAVGRSRDQYERARGNEQEAPLWVRYFDETKLVVDTGIALAGLGEAARAEPLIAEGLRREKAGQQRGRALHAFWLASTQLQQGKLDQACQSAGLALDLTAAIDSPRMAGHVDELRRRMMPYAREAPVIAFEQQMREVLG
ncbi:helix-turn-helix domain-containing protein [Streptomyces sp. A3M-1-3]|uniref:helix-turn-helix domain-containing protein n=1 Tax=Streptomyces sp. A3M-1-3 TaxID=2962044 RepID=UPI0020B8D43A|nr:helix-turn-helix domain-containing protein [Streptomyces sp. A3M-1-3]MCP3821758.1 helix-turn-helix domain-containing protein [Streptomyces sp. A3M-1-3]